MVIKQILSQHRRDFTAEMQCEFCNHMEIDNSCYDDTYYHNEVIPNQKCKKCGESTVSKGAKINPRTPKYPDHVTV